MGAITTVVSPRPGCTAFAASCAYLFHSLHTESEMLWSSYLEDLWVSITDRYHLHVLYQHSRELLTSVIILTTSRLCLALSFFHLSNKWPADWFLAEPTCVSCFPPEVTCLFVLETTDRVELHASIMSTVLEYVQAVSTTSGKDPWHNVGPTLFLVSDFRNLGSCTSMRATLVITLIQDWMDENRLRIPGHVIPKEWPSLAQNFGPNWWFFGWK